MTGAVAGSDAEFAVIWLRAATVPGWLTADQGRALWDAAMDVPAGGRILEIGSHQGRSTTVLAAAALRRKASVVAVDPFVGGAMFGGAPTREHFERNLQAGGLRAAVDLRPVPSRILRRGWTEPLDLVYVDGKHDYWTVSDDLRWADHLPPGGQLLVHDAFSSVGVTIALLRHALPSRRLRYIGRVGSLARFAIAVPTSADRLRMLQELPWWLRNLAIKVALRARRLLGRPRVPDPY